MRIQYLSDVHVEFHTDGGAKFLRSLDASNTDVLVVAGDFAVGAGIGPALDILCAHVAPIPVVYVHGNHEFYGTTRDAVLVETRAASARNANLHWLDCSVAEIAGVRFLGAPLWFREPPANAKFLYRFMSDFSQIREFESWVFRENERAIAFFGHELRKGDVVVTHHLPVEASIAAHWKDSPLNPFFLCDLEALVRGREPKLWIHGHTHDTIDVVVGETRVVANPYGYERIEPNRDFDARAFIDL